MEQLYSFDSPSTMSSSPMINYRKDARKGVKFTMMVVGELGTGKTTFINSLLNQKVLSHRFESNFSGMADTKTLTFASAKSIALPNTSVLTRNDFNPGTAHEEPGFAITETKVEIVDADNTKVSLNVIDTPGFGENLNNEICFVEIENFLKQQFDLVLAEETRIRRNPRFVDTRVHVLIYFISPTGHGLREIDISCMKKLAKYVNIIPVISKADSFTEAELKHFKEQVKIDIERFSVPVFQFDNSLADYDEEEDYELIEECKYLTALQPFAIVSSEDDYEVKDPSTGEKVVIRARQYPWGLVDINNTSYSDFPILKSVVLGSHLQDLKDLTHDFLYETYRTERLMKVTGKDNADDDEELEFDDDTDKTPRHGSFDRNNTTVPSLSNLAQLTNTMGGHHHRDNSSILSSTSSRAPRSMLLDDTDHMDLPSPKIKDDQSFASSASTISLETGNSYSKLGNSNNPAFKRLSIGPQRSQLRQISETVPYVIRHERILERQQKLEEMEMKSAKELAMRAALLEQKAAELKSKEKMLMNRKASESHATKSGDNKNNHNNNNHNNHNNHNNTNNDHNNDDEHNMPGSLAASLIRKEETYVDLHSTISQR